FFRLGAMERFALWRQAGGGAVLGKPLAGRFSRVAEAGRHNRFKPDALSLPATKRRGPQKRQFLWSAAALGCDGRIFKNRSSDRTTNPAPRLRGRIFTNRRSDGKL